MFSSKLLKLVSYILNNKNIKQKTQILLHIIVIVDNDGGIGNQKYHFMNIHLFVSKIPRLSQKKNYIKLTVL